MYEALESKICSLDDLIHLRNQWKKNALRVVFTNGCFDILHEGHVRYLHEAKSLGDILILGLNSDQSVKKLKGPDRPINTSGSRAIVLAGLSSVDRIVVFDDDTPLQLINALLPDILVKGGDWKTEDIVGADVVLKFGGRVYSLPFHHGYSTTLIENKIKANNP